MIKEIKTSRYYKKDMSLFGAFPGSDLLRLRLIIPRSLGAAGVALLIHADAMDFPDDGETAIPLVWESTDGADDIYSCSLELKKLTKDNPDRFLFYYRYKIETANGTEYYGGEEPLTLRPCSEAGDRQLTVFDEKSIPGSNAPSGIIYHIFVDRFFSSGRCSVKGDAFINPDWDNGIPQYNKYPGAKLKNNMFFGGDLWGIAEKLDYIAKLGTDIIYLSPVFEAASNHKYDTGDYLKVDSMFGGDEALKNLCTEARKRGIRVVLDGVFNHTGSDSIYFNREGNYEGGAYNSKESPYYEWYSFNEYPDDYVCWWGVDILPRVDSGNKSYIDFIAGKVIPKWMQLGVGGWRLDVADELDNAFLDRLKKAADKFDCETPIFGEVWEDASDKIAYGRRRRYFQGRQLTSVMNYPLRNGIIDYMKYGDFEKLGRVSSSIYRRYPEHVSERLMNFLSTHDTLRIITVLGGTEQGELTNEELSKMRMTPGQRKGAIKMLKAAFTLLYAFPGTPCIFYGDEAGLEGYRDPFCRRPFPWKNIEEELLEHCRLLGAIRKEEELLSTGLFENIFADENIYALKRTDRDTGRCLIAVINRGIRDVHFAFRKDTSELISGEICKEHTLKPMTGAYFLTDENTATDF